MLREVNLANLSTDSLAQELYDLSPLNKLQIGLFFSVIFEVFLDN